MRGSEASAGPRSTWPTRRSAARSCCSSSPASFRPSPAGSAPKAMDEARRMLIPSDATPARADRWATDLSGLSRSHVQRLISEGRLSAGGVAGKANSIIGPGTELELRIPPPAPATPLGEPELPLSVVYEDADL